MCNMNILFLSAETAPFVSVGGLSQVMYFLPKALIKQGHDVRLFTPLHGATKPLYKKNFKDQVELTQDINVPVQHDQGSAANKDEIIPCRVHSYKRKRGEPFMYFLENEEYYGLRTNVFGYADDHIRFALFSKACLEWLSLGSKNGKKWKPDIIHCHDWHSAYFIELARKHPKYQAVLKNIPIVFTVHNFKYQGNTDFQYAEEGKKDTIHKALVSLKNPELQFQNSLMRGLYYADAVNTVSPTHAREILTPEYSEGLNDILSEIRGKLSGILNGLDISEFNPRTDPNIKNNFSTMFFKQARIENKKDLQKEFGLPVCSDCFVFAYAGRLSSQKGLNLILEVMPNLLLEKPEAQLVVLGGGDDQYRKMFDTLKEQFPNQVGLHLRPNFTLPRKIFAGADMQLIPSMFEPGGIVALEAMRYGAIPLVRATGGLADIVNHFDPETEKGNGFSFLQKNKWSLYSVIIEAMTLYKQPDKWNMLIKNAMSCNFSWDHVAKEYEKWYTRSIEKRKRAVSETPHPAYLVNEF